MIIEWDELPSKEKKRGIMPSPSPLPFRCKKEDCFLERIMVYF
jgi:hypothetical protein